MWHVGLQDAADDENVDLKSRKRVKSKKNQNPITDFGKKWKMQGLKIFYLWLIAQVKTEDPPI